MSHQDDQGEAEILHSSNDWVQTHRLRSEDSVLNQTHVKISRLRQLSLTDSAGVEILKHAPQRCRLLKDCGILGGETFFDFLDTVLFGIKTPNQSGTAAAYFEGTKSIVVERNLANNQVRVLIDEDESNLGTQRSVGHDLFGLNREQFEQAILVDARDYIVPKGEKSLQFYLRRVLLPPEPEIPGPPMPTPEDLATVKAKRVALERQLELMPKAQKSITTEPIDPPDISDLLRALEQTREIEKRLLERRIRLSEELVKTKQLDRAEFLPVSAPMITQLEQLATQLELNRDQTDDLKQRASQPTGFDARAMIVILLLVSGAAAVIGDFLGEAKLTRLAIGLAVTAGSGVVTLWLMRMRTIMNTTKKAKELRKKRSRLRDKAAKICMRVGSAASAEDLSPEGIRQLIDQANRRDTKRQLIDKIAPFVDSEAELKNVRTLTKALETPLTGAAELRDSNLPQVPLVRVTTSAMRLLSDWTRALAENGRNVEDAVAAKVRSEVERDLLEQSLKKVRATETTLQLNSSKQLSKQDMPAYRAANLLNRVAIPLLHRHLGKLAPEKFDEELLPVFRNSPSSTVNSFIALLIRLFNPEGADANIDSIGQIVVDPGMAVGIDLEAPLGQLMANSPVCGSITVTHSRQGMEDSFVRSMALELTSCFGISSRVEQPQTSQSRLYSAHDIPVANTPHSPDILLKSSSD